MRFQVTFTYLRILFLLDCKKKHGHGIVYMENLVQRDDCNQGIITI